MDHSLALLSVAEVAAELALAIAKGDTKEMESLRVELKLRGIGE